MSLKKYASNESHIATGLLGPYHDLETSLYFLPFVHFSFKSQLLIVYLGYGSWPRGGASVRMIGSNDLFEVDDRRFVDVLEWYRSQSSCDISCRWYLGRNGH